MLFSTFLKARKKFHCRAAPLVVSFLGVVLILIKKIEFWDFLEAESFFLEWRCRSLPATVLTHFSPACFYLKFMLVLGQYLVWPSLNENCPSRNGFLVVGRLQVVQPNTTTTIFHCAPRSRRRDYTFNPSMSVLHCT